MIRDLGDRIEVAGNMTLPEASRLLSEGMGLLGRDAVVFDLQAVADVDSTALAVVFAWQRAVRRAGKTMRVANPPRNLMSLAAMYGVGEMLPL